MNIFEKSLLAGLIIACIGATIVFGISSIDKIVYEKIDNDPDIGLEYLMKDLEYSIKMNRDFLYHIEIQPRCHIIKNAIDESSELRKLLERAIEAGIRIKVLVPCSTLEKEAKLFLESSLKIELRIASDLIEECFRVSGSSVTDELLVGDGKHRELIRYKYAPAKALEKIERFNELWDNARSVSEDQ